MKRIVVAKILSAFAIIALIPNIVLACACGCGVFDVGTADMLPTQPGGMAWLEYDYMNQNKDWHDSSQVPAADNDDKRIRSNFYEAGAQYMFGREWGAMVQLPYTDRHFRTTLDDGDIAGVHDDSVGDIRIKGIYTGFSEDMSTGVTYGLRLPTGSHDAPNFDRDTDIGSGSTDILLGGFHVGNLTSDRLWDWFVSGELDQPVLVQNGYRPGTEIDAVVGAYYDDLFIGKVKIAPIAQIIGSSRWRDDGPASDHADSGYERLLLSPGIEADIGNVRMYADIEVPVYQYVNGYQLTAPELFKMNISYKF